MFDLKSRVSCMGACDRSCEGCAFFGACRCGFREGLRLALLIRGKFLGFPSVSRSFACASVRDSAWQDWT
jgi:hypothetical protein